MSVNHVFGKNFTHKFIKTCFMKYLIPSLIKRQLKKESKAITVLQKRGGGPARYDHDHSFNGIFFYPFPYLLLSIVQFTGAKEPKPIKVRLVKSMRGKVKRSGRF